MLILLNLFDNLIMKNIKQYKKYISCYDVGNYEVINQNQLFK